MALEDFIYIGNGEIDEDPLLPGFFFDGAFYGEIEALDDRDPLQITLYAGITYTFDMVRDAGETTLDPYLRLLNFFETLIAEDDDGGGGRDARIVFTPEETGDYYIAPAAYVGLSTGLYKLSVTVQADDVAPETFTGDPQPGAPVLTLGTAREGTIERPSDSDTYAIDLVAGRSYTITVTGRAIDGADFTETDSLEGLFVRLRRPDGGFVDGASDSDGSVTLRHTAGATGRFLVDVEELGLDAAGGYRIVATADQPSLSVSDATVVEGGGALSFTVSLSAAATAPVSVSYATANGTASAGADYTATSGALNFAAGERTKTVTVAATPDALIETDETLFLRLSGATGATLADAEGQGVIRNDDLPRLSVADASITEGDAGRRTMAFTVTLDAAAPFAVGVDYATANGTATAGSDFVATSGRLFFAAGDRSKTVAVTINGDLAAEPTESFTLRLSNAANATIARATATGTILDDERPSLSVSDATVVEGGGALSFTVSLSAAATAPVSVSYATANGTASAGADYTATSGALNFAAGERTKTVTVAATPDALIETDETLFLRLSGATGATLADAEGQGVIRNDDRPRLSVADASVVEGASGQRTMTFTVTLDAAAPFPVGVDYATANGTATAGSDYVATSGRLFFAAGERSKTVAVTINGDVVREPTESFTLRLSNAANAIIARATATGAIVTDEGATAGNDTLFASAADETLDGLAGNDTVSYELLRSGIVVTLASGAVQDTGGGGRDLIRNVENLIGGAGDDDLAGNGGRNRIDGGAGDDTLAGGGGRGDTLAGGAGDDVFIRTYREETVVEAAGGGRDKILAFASKTALPAHVEDLRLAAPTATVGLGNGRDNRIEGNDARNLLIGGGGDDTLLGGAGFDRIAGGDGRDRIVDRDRGGRLAGDAGDDVILGGDGAYVYGGAGRDRIEAGDLARVWGDLYNNRSSGSADDILAGGRARVFAGGGDDTVAGGLGSRLAGENGNDLLIVDAGLGGADRTTLEGGVGDDVFFLNARATGAVRIADSSGDDVLLLQDFDSTTTLAFRRDGDLVVQLFDPDAETSGVYASVEFLNQYVGANTLEFVAFTEEGGGPDNWLTYRLRRSLTGSDDNDLIAGTNAANTLSGGLGDDILYGADGADRLIGDEEADFSDDILVGGRGADTLLGGNGEDQFRFRRDDLGTGVDVIQDFDISNDVIDMIDLLRLLEADDPRAGGFLRLRQVGGNLEIQVDLDGSGNVDGGPNAGFVTAARLIAVDLRDFQIAATAADPTANLLY